MALDATVAGSSASSYLTVGEADGFAVSDLGTNAQKWREAHPETKEAALIRATAEIDEFVGRVARSYATTQALLFPRWDDLIPGTSTPFLPVRLKRAVYLQAAYLIANADLIDGAASRRSRGLVNFANPDGTSGQVADDGSFGRLSPRAETIMGEFVEGAVIGTIVTT